MPGTDLTYASAPLEDRMNWARAIAGAGDLVPAGFRDRNGTANPAKILLAAEYGAMIGLHPMAALTGINVIEGKPSPSPALMSALVRSAGHKLRVETTGTWEAGDFTATVTLIRSDDMKHPFIAVWNQAKAKRAGLVPASSPKSSWARYPEAMCKWRAMSEVCRDGAEDVLLGAHYVPEELGATVNEAGEVIEDAEVIEQDHADHAVTTVRAEPAKKPPTASAASWMRDIQAAETMQALTELRQMAVGADALGLRSREGHTVDEWFLRRRDELQQAAAGEPEPATEEYADEDPALTELPF